jgi:hypothetical protein
MLPAELATKAGSPRNHPPSPKPVLEFVGDQLRRADNDLESSKEFAELAQIEAPGRNRHWYSAALHPLPHGNLILSTNGIMRVIHRR